MLIIPKTSRRAIQSKVIIEMNQLCNPRGGLDWHVRKVARHVSGDHIE